MATEGSQGKQITTPGAEATMGPRPLIAVAGSTRASAGARTLARELGESLVSAGFRIACGGLGGVMAATARGAHQSAAWTGNEVIGLLPGWEANEGNAWIDIPLRTGLGRYRNMLLASACDALVAVEGGAGTLSEMALAWQEDRPLLVLGKAGTSGKIAGRALDVRCLHHGFSLRAGVGGPPQCHGGRTKSTGAGRRCSGWPWPQTSPSTYLPCG